jgi:hypothetical protein
MVSNFIYETKMYAKRQKERGRVPLFDLQAEFPDVDSEDSEGKETDKDITGTDIESPIHEADAAADDVLPVQIERWFNKLNTLIVHS